MRKIVSVNTSGLIGDENQCTEFEYYPDGKLKLERRPMDEETRYKYDNLGRLWKIIDAKNQTIDGIVFLNGKIVGRKNPSSPGESVEDLFHVRHWISRGDQETRLF